MLGKYVVGLTAEWRSAWHRSQVQRNQVGQYLLAAGVLALLGLVTVNYVMALRHALHILGDWHAYYRAALHLRGHQDIYSEAKLLLAHNNFKFWQETNGQYVYPPFFALLLVPLTILSDSRAGEVWLLASTAAAIAFIWAMLSALRRPFRLVPAAFVALIVLGSEPLLLDIEYGQVDVVVLLITTLSLLAYLRRRDGLAGLLLGIAVAIKPTLLLYGLFYVRKRQWRTLGIAAVTALTAVLGSFAFVGWGALTDWLRISHYYSFGDYAAYAVNQSLHALLLRAFVGDPLSGPLVPIPQLATCLWVVGVLGAAALWWRHVSASVNRDNRAALEYGLTVVLVLWAAPLAEDIHYVALLMPLVVLLDAVLWSRPSVSCTVLAVASCAYYVQPWLTWFAYRGSTNIQHVPASGIYLYGLLIVGGALIMLIRELRPDSEPRAELVALPYRAD